MYMYIQHTELYMYNLLYICSPPHVYFKHKEYIIPLYVLSACMYILVFVHVHVLTYVQASMHLTHALLAVPTPYMRD